MRARGWNCGAVVCFVAVFTLPCAVCQDYTEKACPGGMEDSPPVEVTLTCPPGQVVSLGEAVFGRNKYGACTFIEGDCKDKTDAFDACEGRYNCTVHFDRPLSPNCGYATFIRVSYDCQTVAATPPPIVRVPTVARDNSDDDVTMTSETRPRDAGGAKKSQEDNTGIIVGCVVAVVVTIVLLIIAIIMVVRRLACGADLPGEEEKKSSACHVLPCVGMEQNENSAKSGLDAEADAENAGNTRKRKRRGRRADKNQNMSPRLAPVGQEDEEDGSSAQNKTGDLAAGACGEEVMTGGGGRSARSSAVVESAAQLKRHSSGAKVMIRDVTDDEGGGHGDVSRGGGEGGGGGVQTKGRGVGVPTGGGGRVGNPGVSKADVNRTNQDTQAMIEAVKTHQPSAAMVAPSDVTRTQPPDRAQTRAAVTSSHRRSQYDAVAVPNTETFTSC